MPKKLKLLFQTDSSLAKTGFGRNAKAVLSYLYNTGKYDITHYCIGVNGPVVNIDPDFMTYSDHSSNVDNFSWKVLGNLVGSPDFIPEKLSLEDRKKRTAVKSETRSKMDSDTILDYLPLDLRESRALENISVENL